MIRIAVFASGEGTNLQALLDACKSRRIRGEVALVVSSSAEAGALKRAARAGVETLVALSKDFPSPDAYNAFLAAECKKREIDLICLAGFMLLLKEPLLNAFQNRILNIHPALLPAFGGKGMYGTKVHEAVVASGARFSGCTVHFVDAVYDHGPVVTQASVPVLPGDTAAELAARVLRQEHWIYPEAVKLFAENRLQVANGKVRVLPSHNEASGRIKRALLSVSDKTGLIDFARALEGMGIEIVSTSGTAKLLRDAGVEVRPLDSMTGFPEILSGRVKTLHPRIHGGILLRRADPAQAKEASLFGLEPIDLVVVNLYPFEKTAAKASSPYSREVIEDIDIGGVTLIRAAAKNFEDVAIVVSPADYSTLLGELSASSCQLNLETRRRLALAAFEHTAAYDAMISKAWAAAAVPAGARPASAPPDGAAAPADARFPERMTVELTKIQDLRYGETPHQTAALYARGAASFEQLHGKELSYNNLLDAFGTWDAVSDISMPGAVIFKHVTPSGMAADSDLTKAFERAWACDTVSAFGGILAVNRTFPASIAELLAKRFMEVVVAPDYAPEALALLKQKPNLRILRMKAPPTQALLLRALGDEVLVTEPDRLTFGGAVKCVTKRAPTKEEEAALRFAWVAAKHVKSNAIVLADAGATVGIGAGQMSRVDSVHMAGVKLAEYLKANPAPKPLALASDAFFPFRDGIDAAAKLGISAVIQPGGSIRDAEVIAAADELGLAMVFTGMRHFRH
ncbi:MAG TPA: bifunctional phosphoribosylaminoimidazolecarboxamide formyltransferase/IMP cyclohydrolase [Elusimicrobiota bacterium]|nr:bifunctional phosphoribosylaminoimidazolecarboxamide formyltransferase/IMP cyclohydrolase [Elusimicrobiota bacterium]